MKYDVLLVWGIFRKFPFQAKLSFSPYACACKGRERVFPFFLRLAALCMVLLGQFKILLGASSEGTKVVRIRSKLLYDIKTMGTTNPTSKQDFKPSKQNHAQCS